MFVPLFRPAASLNPQLHPLFGVQIGSLPKPARRILVHGDDPSSVDASALLSSLPLHPRHTAAARHSLRSTDAEDTFASAPGILSRDAAAALREWASGRFAATERQRMDSVDGCPEWQAEIDLPTLAETVGEETVDSLLASPSEVAGEGRRVRKLESSEGNAASDGGGVGDVGIFVRKYAAGGRPFIGFHVDDCDATVNVCLSDPDECTGGTLLLLASGKVHAPRREIGEATAHSWSVCHGVSGVTEGTRWSLILFFSNHYQPDHAGFYKKIMDAGKKKKRKKR
eukprot:CAMPEP_0113301024 /NCGR_PEP_ID=MMETSP0010_2-20120614/2417_1 /TAXON_ID=216773 ORGANISM="Corethron hystrix, Strain 308" /NCGR_SAMPLE_ID=MMETSP0010_2 /ASSEMBLY_ACC=CAM_ASM_000155 /LENGTH=283 /DNA_ID=CAMNT_0000154561 /DNA_START=407 /DNA_END=1259 /DNA_ORIENTATION=+ /assembly_acc=CAM_ASM_000155